MALNSLPIRPEDLLEHASWLSTLAAGLVMDPTAADDVVQDTYVAALRTPPDGSRELAPWLSRVARNFAKKRARTDGRRSDREHTAARAEAVNSPDAILERLEMQRVLAEELRALDEPWRSAIVLRYVEGRTSVELAAILGVPEGTVRWRLKCALDTLRVRLDRRFGGSRESWCAVLAPLGWRASAITKASAVKATGAGAFAPGGLAMGAVLKFGAVLTLATVAGALWWEWRAEVSVPAPSAIVLSAELSTATPVRSEEERSALQLDGAARVARDLPESTSPNVAPLEASPATSAALPPRTPARVDARFVDASGRALAGVSFGNREQPKSWTETGPDGLAFIEVVPSVDDDADWMAHLEARCPGLTTRALYPQLHSGGISHLGDVALDSAGTFSVLVVDEAGLAVPDVEVWTVPCGKDDKEEFQPVPEAVFRPLEHRVGPEARTDVDGHAELPGVGAGDWRVTADRHGWRAARSDRCSVLAGQVVALKIEMTRLLDTDWISGRVLDPTGAFIPHPKVRFTAHNASGGATVADVESNERGEFKLALDPAAHYDIVAKDPLQRWTNAVAIDVPHGESALILQLTDPRFLEARVSRRGGGRIGGAKVASLEEGVLFEDVEVVADAKGVARVAIPPRPFQVSAGAAGYRPVKQGPFASSAPPTVLEFELTPQPMLRGTVRAHGEPVAGARIELREHVREGTLIVNQFLCRMEAYAASTAITDSEGAYSISVPKDGRFFVRAVAAGFAPAELGPLELSGEDSRDGFGFELGVGGTIEGRVLASDGRDTAGTVVAINHGDGEPRTLRAGPSGAFNFSGLASGRWQVELRSEELRVDLITMSTPTEPAPIHWTCDVLDGRTTTHDLELDTKKP